MAIRGKINCYDDLGFFGKLLVRLSGSIVGGTLLFLFVILFVNIASYILLELDFIRGRYRFFIPSRSIFSFFIGAIFCWIKTPTLFDRLVENFRANLRFRYLLFGSLFYAISLTLFIHLFEPGTFRRGLYFIMEPIRYDDDMVLYLKLLIYPILTVLLGMYLYSKATTREADQELSNSNQNIEKHKD